jgi:DNA-binding transcriptional ArsR family regulator
MTLTGLKKHVRILEDAHLVTTQKVGRVRQCRIDTAALKTAEDWISERRTIWEARLDRLGDYLAENPHLPAARRTLSGAT